MPVLFPSLPALDTGCVVAMGLMFALRLLFPYGVVLGGILFVGACDLARRRAETLAWGFFAAGWCLPLLGVGQALLSCSRDVAPDLRTAAERQDCVLQSYFSGIAVPLLLTLPTVLYIRSTSSGGRSPARKWFIWCPIIAFVNVTMLAGFLLLVLART